MCLSVSVCLDVCEWLLLMSVSVCVGVNVWLSLWLAGVEQSVGVT